MSRNFLPSGERMYLAWIKPYMSQVSELSCRNYSFASSSVVGAYFRFIKALHCISLALGRFNSVRNPQLNSLFKKFLSTGKRNSCPSS